ncbi:hypothetical protein SDC9_52669 [bioreactor metagenome]|uniref:Uncharacterized protein n=1 Tax=bioreactor metagenome TaxID=1076179 RepID=A0A644WRA9_9ZZZZ
MNDSRNDSAWEQLFKKHDILKVVSDSGYATISATSINEFREARLMTKIDHKSQLPKPFAANKLSILPTSRGNYIIGAFETFCSFNNDDVAVTKFEFPAFLESLDYKNISSEATAINCAFVSKILHDFTLEENLWPTVSGRMGSSVFDFEINSASGRFRIDVGNSQVEIDGGYEGDESLNLIEAKNYISDDFLVRQLYYPYKLWTGKINKRVRPIFLTYSNGVFHLREYEFSDINHYNSLVLLKHKKYAIQDDTFNIETIERIIETTPENPEPHVPFPQADSFERVINLCELLNQKYSVLKEDITQNYDFEWRQTDYYSNAGKYLGLIDTDHDDNKQPICFLTEKGKRLFSLNLSDRQKALAKIIISFAAFKKSLKLYLTKGEMPSKHEIVEIMKQSKLYNIESDATYHRRASTICGWINWIVGQIEE